MTDSLEKLRSLGLLPGTPGPDSGFFGLSWIREAGHWEVMGHRSDVAAAFEALAALALAQRGLAEANAFMAEGFKRQRDEQKALASDWKKQWEAASEAENARLSAALKRADDRLCAIYELAGESVLPERRTAHQPEETP